MAQEIEIYKNFKLDLKSFKFGAMVGLALLLIVFFLDFFWPLMAVYMFIFMLVGYEKDGGLEEVLSLASGQATTIIPISIAFSLIANNFTAFINSLLAFAIALAAILAVEIISKNREKKEPAKATG